MVKIVQNEFKKFFSSKTFIFEILLMVGLCVLSIVAYKDMANIAAEELPRAEAYSDEFTNVLMNMNGVAFAKLFLTDFIYKDYISFFLLFVVIYAVNTFSSDRENGTMKFTLLTGVDQKTLIAGKLVFMACAIGVILLFNMVLSLLVGFIAFGGKCDFLQLLEYIGLNALTILPGLAIAVIVAVLSQIRVSSKVIMGVGLVMVFILGMLDAMTPTIHFSPVGALSHFSAQIPAIDPTLLLRYLVSLVYCVVGSLALLGITKNYEYYE